MLTELYFVPKDLVDHLFAFLSTLLEEFETVSP